MGKEEAEKFEGSYIRSRRVLNTINNIALREAQRGLQNIDNPESFNTGAEWANFAAWNAGYRYGMRYMDKLTKV